MKIKERNKNIQNMEGNVFRHIRILFEKSLLIQMKVSLSSSLTVIFTLLGSRMMSGMEV